MKKRESTKATETINVPAPNFEVLECEIEGTSPLVIHKFSQKSREMMRQKQELGSKAKRGGKREAKDFKAAYEGAKHVSQDGWCGIPAASFRHAMISACRTVGFTMTRAKLAFFIEQDGIDRDDGMPLVKIKSGEPRQHEAHVRLETGVADIRVRPMWESWTAIIRIRFDADMLDRADIVNLLARAGQQVGICEGRPDSKKGCGLGWGLFRIKEEKS